ncbi:hypothetical protein ACOME3_000426 [Neoechinorhynchus agilis]
MQSSLFSTSLQTMSSGVNANITISQTAATSDPESSMVTARSSLTRCASCVPLPQREISIRVLLLDNRKLNYTLRKTQKASVLFEQIFSFLSIEETEYFGLTFQGYDALPQWLEPKKSLGRQLSKRRRTRQTYQAELGDYVPSRDTIGYASEFAFIPRQTEEMELRAVRRHQNLTGMPKCRAELYVLNKVKWLDTYGLESYPVVCEDNRKYRLGFTPTGVMLYKRDLVVYEYFWPRIESCWQKKDFMFLRVMSDLSTKTADYRFSLTTKHRAKLTCKQCVRYKAFFEEKSTQRAAMQEMRRATSVASSIFNNTRTSMSESMVSGPVYEPPVERIPSVRRRRRSYSIDATREIPENEEIVFRRRHFETQSECGSSVRSRSSRRSNTSFVSVHSRRSHRRRRRHRQGSSRHTNDGRYQSSSSINSGQSHRLAEHFVDI